MGRAAGSGERRARTPRPAGTGPRRRGGRVRLAGSAHRGRRRGPGARADPGRRCAGPARRQRQAGGADARAPGGRGRVRRRTEDRDGLPTAHRVAGHRAGNRRSLRVRPGAGRGLAAGHGRRRRRRAAHRAGRAPQPRRHGRRGTLCGVGAACAAGRAGRRFQWLGRPPPSVAPASPGRRLGTVRARAARRRALPVRDPRCRRHAAAAQGRSGRPPQHVRARHRLGGARCQRLRLARHGLAGAARSARRRRAADEHLRSACRLLAPRRARPAAAVGCAGRAPDPVRARDGLHPSRTAADRRISVRRLLGLPAAGPVRADRAAWRRGRFRALRRCLPSGRDRGDPGLGRRAFPRRRAWPAALRRHRAVRARRPARRRASRVEHADLQLRPRRSGRLPDRQRAGMDRALPRRWPARGCGGGDAVPRLRPQRGRMGTQCPGRAREPGGDRVPAPAQCRDRAALPRGAGDGRGIHRLAGRDRTAGAGRAGLQPQVEHGLDA
ncbi:hypothetical protein XTG29_01905 [Xanthomonas translucens pv. graminis ART-Xtg29]|nr:hypothetical protein XTG29_01905 [Xanthomonas translucens pv. graminis ART-Xtg29]